MMALLGFRWLWINPMLGPFPERGTYLVRDGVTYRVLLSLPRRRLLLLRRTSPHGRS